jgi:hypothetical protein
VSYILRYGCIWVLRYVRFSSIPVFSFLTVLFEVNRSSYESAQTAVAVIQSQSARLLPSHSPPLAVAVNTASEGYPVSQVDHHGPPWAWASSCGQARRPNSRPPTRKSALEESKPYGMEESLRASGASIQRRRGSKVDSESRVDGLRITLDPHSTGTAQRVVCYMIYMIFIE